MGPGDTATEEMKSSVTQVSNPVEGGDTGSQQAANKVISDQAVVAKTAEKALLFIRPPPSLQRKTSRHQWSSKLGGDPR